MSKSEPETRKSRKARTVPYHQNGPLSEDQWHPGWFVDPSSRGIRHDIDSIAAIDGVDVLFIGLLDLSRDLGIFGQFDHSLFLNAVRITAQAAQRAGKQAGIIIDGPANLSKYWDLGYRFVACVSDGSLLNSAARNLADSLKSHRSQIAEPHGRLA